MDLESHETDGLLKKRTPKRQGLAVKLVVALYSIPANEIKERYDGAVGGFFVPGQQIFNASYPGREEEWPIYASTPFPMKVDMKDEVAANNKDVDSVYWHGVVGSVENEWYGTTAGSEVDVLIVQSNYPNDINDPVIILARGAKWAFTQIYGRLAVTQAAGAAPVIEAWIAGELPATVLP